ncbi:hypothetical protein [Macrococcoides bohemicum]|uniref:hypothetical protein n=1 Tax=Macrococcoides bohemicum TaxID=1903056 RepID=UPI00165E1D96|nr:hypothetical protein [Macrococcus bohemicus]MBC9873244.1 hypothetical protein [Macrococcus bohemicus]
MYQCYVCGYEKLEEQPYVIVEPKINIFSGSFEICPCCQFQYGYDEFHTYEYKSSNNIDVKKVYKLYRENWIMNGAPTYLDEYINGLKDKGYVPKEHVIQGFNSIGIYEEYKYLIQEIL